MPQMQTFCWLRTFAQALAQYGSKTWANW